MRNEKLPTILVLTSVNPHKGPAVVAETAYQAFLHQGFDVDFMCPYPVDGHPEYLQSSVFTTDYYSIFYR